MLVPIQARYTGPKGIIITITTTRFQPWLSGQNTQFVCNESWIRIPERTMAVAGRPTLIRS